MKIFTVVGCRPNFIKIDPELPQYIIHTGQHYDYEMSQIFFEGLKLPKPACFLNHKSERMGKMVDGLRALFQKKKPTLVIVFGDTVSSLAGALAAAYEKIKVCHIEAGLRSYTAMPEEINRVMIDHLATMRICPTDYAEMNLWKEGLKKDNYVCGDPLFDSFGRCLPIPKVFKPQSYSVFTLHRDFNVDDKKRLIAIMRGLKLSNRHLIWPIHPRTSHNLKKWKVVIPKNVEAVSPKGYLEFLVLLGSCEKVITDSGGVQREAYWMNIPLIIIRKETEWIDIISRGAGILVDIDSVKIAEAIRMFKGTLNPPPQPGVNKRIREIIYKYA